MSKLTQESKHQIFHFIAKSGDDIQSFLTQLNLSLERQTELFELGAIYLNKKRVLSNQVLNTDDHIRIHTQPRRFKVPEDLEVVFSNDHFIVINKPPGLPSHPTLDNSLENSKSLIEKKLGETVWLPHRLDVNTSGLLVFARTKKFLHNFSLLLETQKVRKVYKAVCTSTDQLPKITSGEILKHYMKPSQRCPKELSSESLADWKKCLLKVVDVKYRDLPKSLAELKVELITGRTHQIRSQLSFIGLPILGDQLYGSKFDSQRQLSNKPLFRQNSDPIALSCIELQFMEHHFRIDS